jgi:miniconductance mechanosensitive channel
MFNIKDLISQYLGLESTGIYSSLIEISLYIFIFTAIYYLFKNQVINRGKEKMKTKGWQFGIFLSNHNLFVRSFALIPVGILLSLSKGLENDIVNQGSLLLFTGILYINMVVLVFSFLNAFVDYTDKKGLKKIPFKPISQVIKIIIIFIALIVFYSKIINESPFNILASLGAMSALILIICRESIMGLVAGIQISIYNLVEKGDWITIDSLGVDGDVVDINLNVITIKNFDNTITTIPTSSLLSTSFKNYRNMFSNGRRIKRTINLDTNTFKNLKESDIQELMKIETIKDYLEEKFDLIKDNLSNDENGFISVDKRYLTNIGTFRKYIYYYLKNNDLISNNNTLIVRQRDNIGKGLPLEIYCFTVDTSWVHNEDTASDIFDHLYTVLRVFGLSAYQEASGNDFKKLL